MKRRTVLFGTPLAAAALALARSRGVWAAPTTTTLLHCNDVYEIAPKDGQGGFAEFMTLLRQERARNPNSVTSFGGDLISPSVLSGLTKGEQMIELTNAIGIQVAVLGNHEYDFGPDLTRERVSASRYPWLGTNVLGPDGKPASGATDYQLFDVGGYKLGFFGLLTPDTVTLSSPGPDIRFADPKATAASSARALREMGADLVIALTHLDLADDRALVAEVDEVDIVLGGHDHEPITFYEGQKLIVKAGTDLRYLAAVDLVLERVEEDGKETVVWRPAWRFVSTAGVTPDPEIAPIVARWNARLDAELGVEVGRTEVLLDSRRATVRTKESNLGDLFADAIRSATGAELAITNGGGIRGDRTYPAGTVLTRKDILTELPFGNVTVLVELTGAEIKAALENGVSQVEDTAGRFPQVSGLAFTFDQRRPAGQRVTVVSVGGAALDPARTYKVATNDYILSGGDGYAALTGGRVLIDASAGTLMASTVISYITAMGGVIAPEVEGRITRTGS